jgi:hypothetical protein
MKRFSKLFQDVKKMKANKQFGHKHGQKNALTLGEIAELYDSCSVYSKEVAEARQARKDAYEAAKYRAEHRKELRTEQAIEFFAKKAEQTEAAKKAREADPVSQLYKRRNELDDEIDELLAKRNVKGISKEEQAHLDALFKERKTITQDARIAKNARIAQDKRLSSGLEKELEDQLFCDVIPAHAKSLAKKYAKLNKGSEASPEFIIGTVRYKFVLNTYNRLGRWAVSQAPTGN